MEEDEITTITVKYPYVDYSEQPWLPIPFSFILQSPYEEALCRS